MRSGGSVQRTTYLSFRATLAESAPLKVAGVHSALGGLLAQEAGFAALWASSFEISAVRGLPDASVLTMTEYLQAAADVQKVTGIPVVADCDSGFGNNMNVAHMVHEYERAGITAVCVEDKPYPKMNSFAAGQALVDAGEFARKVEVAKRAQSTPDFSGSDELFKKAFDIYKAGYPANEFTGLPTAEDLMRQLGQQLQTALDGQQSMDDALKNAQTSWVIGSSSSPSAERARPCTEWLCAADTTSGRARWTWEWIAKAASLTG